MTATIGAPPKLTSSTNLYVTAAALTRPALRQRSVFKVTSWSDRPATAAIAHDLARCMWPGHAGLRHEPLPNRAIGAIVTIVAILTVAPGRRCFRAPLFAFIVVIEERALPADDFATAVAIGLEAVLADHRTDARRLELDRVKRIDTRNLDIESRLGVTVETAPSSAARPSSIHHRHRR